MTPSDCLAAW